MGHNEIPNAALKPVLLSPSPFHFSTSLSSFKGIRVAQKRKSVCVSMLRVSGSKCRWDMTSSFILPSALALWGQALCLSHLHSTILFSFFHTFSSCHRWKQDTTGNEREQALIREGGLGQRDWNNKTFKTGNSNLGGLETRLTGGRFLFLLAQQKDQKRNTVLFNCLVSMFFFCQTQRPFKPTELNKTEAAVSCVSLWYP